MTPQDLIEYAKANPRLVRMRPSVRFPHLTVFKYTKTAFFDGRWNRFLEESRGTVLSGLDSGDPKIVILPFRKIYNYGIDRESPVFPGETRVKAYRKVNGFMLAVTRVPGVDELVFSTTGSLDSDYVSMGRDVYLNTTVRDKFDSLIDPGYTYMFECVHPNDPHIIPENIGLHYIGRRAHDFSARVLNESKVRLAFYEATGLLPACLDIQLSDLVEQVNRVSHEGYVFYTDDGRGAKLKSPYYLSAKMFARGDTDVLLNGKAKNILDEELWPLVDHVKANRSAFSALDEQARLVFCREFLDNIFNTPANR